MSTVPKDPMRKSPLFRRVGLRRWAPLAFALLLAAAAGCKGAIPIQELLSNASGCDGQTVQVAGEVKSAAGVLGHGVYQVDDGTGTITVVTEKGGVPVQGSKVGVRGTFHSAFTVGTDVVAVIVESERQTR